MPRLPLTLACWNYDRTRALADGRVQVDGIELNYLNLPVEETFFRMLRHHEFDVAEMSLSSYVLSLFTPERPFPFATTYTVTVDSTATAVSGRRLVKPTTFSFTTPTARLASLTCTACPRA